MPSAITRIACCALSGAVLTGLLAGTAHASPPAANPDAPVPPTRYQPSSAYTPPAAEPATPDRNWKEQNRIVAAGASHDHAAHEHAGHAGHAMPAAAPADPHAGHTMHQAAPVDPHAGHAMHHAAPAPAPAPAPAAPAHQHEGHH